MGFRLLFSILISLLVLPMVSATESIPYGEYSTNYLNSDGTGHIQQQLVPENFLDSNGEWQKINTSLRALTAADDAYQYGYRYGATDTRLDVYVKSSTSSSYPFAINVSGHTVQYQPISMGYLDWDSKTYQMLHEVQPSNAVVDNNEIKYVDAFYHTNITRVLSSWKWKEEILLGEQVQTWIQNNPPSSYDLSDDESYLVFYFKLNTTSLDIHKDGVQRNVTFEVEDGRMEFRNQGDLKWFLPLEEAYELNNVSSKVPIKFRIVGAGSTRDLYFGVKVSDLNTMSFPVVFDPTDTTSVVNSDGRMQQKLPTNKNNDPDLSMGPWLGGTSGVGRHYMVITLPEDPGNTIIDNITIGLYKYDQQNSGVSFNIEMHNLTQAGPLSLDNDVTWNAFNRHLTEPGVWDPWATPGGDYNATIIDSVTRTTTTQETHVYCLVGDCAINPTSSTWGDRVELLFLNNSIGHYSGVPLYEVYGAINNENVTRRPVVTISYSAFPSYSDIRVNRVPHEDQNFQGTVNIANGGSSLSDVIWELNVNGTKRNYTGSVTAGGGVHTFDFEQGGNYTAHDVVNFSVTATSGVGSSWSGLGGNFTVANQAPTAPNITVPSDGSTLTANPITINITQSTDADAEDTFTYWLFVNGLVNKSFSGSGLNQNFPDLSSFNISVLGSDSYDNSSLSANISFSTLFDASPTITINFPSDAVWNSSRTINHGYTPIDDSSITSAKLYTNITGVLTNTLSNTSAITNGSVNIITYTYSGEIDIQWLIEVCDDASQCTNSSTQKIYIDIANPSVTTGETSSGYYQGFTDINATITDTHLEIVYLQITDQSGVRNETPSTNGNVYYVRNASYSDDSYKIEWYVNDSAGKVTRSTPYNITMDNSFPTISSFSATSITQTGVTINSDANEVTNTTVYYSTDTSYSSMATDADYVTTSAVILSSLPPGKNINYKIGRCDQANNCVNSSTDSFSTLAQLGDIGGGGGGGGGVIVKIVEKIIPDKFVPELKLNITGTKLYILYTTSDKKKSIYCKVNIKNASSCYDEVFYDTDEIYFGGAAYFTTGILTPDAYAWYDNDRIFGKSPFTHFRLPPGTHRITLVVTDVSGRVFNVEKEINVLRGYREPEDVPTIPLAPETKNVFERGLDAVSATTGGFTEGVSNSAPGKALKKTWNINLVTIGDTQVGVNNVVLFFVLPISTFALVIPRIEI